MNSNKMQDEKTLISVLDRLISGKDKVYSREEVEAEANVLAEKFKLNCDVKHCVEMIMIDIDTRMSPGISLVDYDKPHDNGWVEELYNDIKWTYSDAYNEFLRRGNLAPKVVETLDIDGRNILSNLQNPKTEGSWDRRGLVIGHVQSGKTANYINVIARAADAGYKFIIVIAGIHNNLRRQTQQRIEWGFVGRSSRPEDRQKPVGVGLQMKDFPHPVTITTVDSDFKKEVARQSKWKLNDFSKPIIFVIKKNVTTLKSLHQWLQQMNADGDGQISDVPMLMIDDEADNASINTNKPDLDPTKTNGLIREILGLFAKSSYIGYTATPFANIFINPDAYDEKSLTELFPRDFIYSLDAPTAYFGPDQVFLNEESSNSIVREIYDCENYIPFKHDKNHDIADLPPSLYMAINHFIVTRAIRNLRGQVNSHHSMMVNVSRFISVQKDVRALISNYVKKVQNAVKANYALPESLSKSNDHMKELEQCFVSEFGKCDFSWLEVKKQLCSVFGCLRVYMVNSLSDEALDYEKYEKDGTGLTAIAVGGLSLSRGLTIEGLCISYMYRNTRMYDTLMQMGRWFGYRPNYEDLCRVYLSSDSIDWYAHIAEATDELKQQIIIMKSQRVSPKDFGLYVASHPDQLLITAPNKMRMGEKIKLRHNLSMRLREVTILPTDEAINGANENLIKKLWKEEVIGGRKIDRDEKRGWFILNVPISTIINFILKFETHADYAFHKKAILDFVDIIKDTHKAGDIVLRSVEKNDANKETFTLGHQVRKTWLPGNDYWKNKKSRVGSSDDENIGLSKEQIEEAEKKMREEKNKRGRAELYYRLVRDKPLLLLHIVGIKSKDGLSIHRVPTFGISFPSGNYDKSVDIVANPKYIAMMFGDMVDHVEDEDDYDH